MLIACRLLLVCLVTLASAPASAADCKVSVTETAVVADPSAPAKDNNRGESALDVTKRELEWAGFARGKKEAVMCMVAARSEADRRAVSANQVIFDRWVDRLIGRGKENSGYGVDSVAHDEKTKVLTVKLTAFVDETKVATAIGRWVEAFAAARQPVFVAIQTRGDCGNGGKLATTGGADALSKLLDEWAVPVVGRTVGQRWERASVAGFNKKLNKPRKLVAAAKKSGAKLILAGTMEATRCGHPPALVPGFDQMLSAEFTFDFRLLDASGKQLGDFSSTIKGMGMTTDRLVERLYGVAEPEKMSLELVELLALVASGGNGRF